VSTCGKLPANQHDVVFLQEVSITFLGFRRLIFRNYRSVAVEIYLATRPPKYCSYI